METWDAIRARRATREYDGTPLADADLERILEAGRRRLRPILMTTSTTVLAMLPIALALGEGSEIQAPLARVVLGGLLFSTAITLALLPALYVLTAVGTAPERASDH